MSVTKHVDKFFTPHVKLTCQLVSQDGVEGQVIRNAQENVCRPLKQNAGQSFLWDIHVVEELNHFGGCFFGGVLVVEPDSFRYLCNVGVHIGKQTLWVFCCPLQYFLLHPLIAMDVDIKAFIWRQVTSPELNERMTRRQSLLIDVRRVPWAQDQTTGIVIT